MSRPSTVRVATSTWLAASTAALAVTWACIAGPGDDGHDALRLEILRSEVDHVLAPTYAACASAAADLDAKVTAWSAALAAGDDGVAARDEARTAYVDFMAQWQRAEVLQIGPAGSSAYVRGGEDLRDAVYSWPTADACRVDEETVAQGYAAADFDTALVNVRGLDALEQLLFADPATNACAATDEINQSGSWTALGDDEVTKRRAAYAAVLAAQIHATTTDLADTWASGGRFAGYLVAPGEGGSPYDTPAQALDDVLLASAYVDLIVKDHKLAADAPATLETPLAGHAKAHVQANLVALQQLVWGGASASEGTGLDDFLIELDEAALADELLASIEDAIASVDAVDGEFADALAADPAALAGSQAAVLKVIELLDGRVATALGLHSPSEAAGDAD